jgi:hypothetical protein
MVWLLPPGVKIARAGSHDAPPLVERANNVGPPLVPAPVFNRSHAA